MADAHAGDTLGDAAPKQQRPGGVFLEIGGRVGVDGVQLLAKQRGGGWVVGERAAGGGELVEQQLVGVKGTQLRRGVLLSKGVGDSPLLMGWVGGVGGHAACGDGQRGELAVDCGEPHTPCIVENQVGRGEEEQGNLRDTQLQGQLPT